MTSLFNYESDLRLLIPGQYKLDEFDALEFVGGSYLIVAKNKTNKTEFTEFFLTHDTTASFITNVKTTSDANNFIVTLGSDYVRNYVRFFVTLTEDVKIKFYRQLVTLE